MAKKATQEQLAQLMDVSQQAIQKLVSKGVLRRGATLEEWVIAYARHMAKVAAGHRSQDGELDLVKERARLASRQSEKLEIDTARLRGELLPKEVVSAVLSFHNATIRSRLLAIPNRLKAQRPDVSVDAILALKTLIHETLTELAHVRLPADIDARTRQYFLDLHAATKSNGDTVG